MSELGTVGDRLIACQSCSNKDVIGLDAEVPRPQMEVWSMASWSRRRTRATSSDRLDGVGRFPHSSCSPIWTSFCGPIRHGTTLQHDSLRKNRLTWMREIEHLVGRIDSRRCGDDEQPQLQHQAKVPSNSALSSGSLRTSELGAAGEEVDAGASRAGRRVSMLPARSRPDGPEESTPGGAGVPRGVPPGPQSDPASPRVKPTGSSLTPGSRHVAADREETQSPCLGGHRSGLSLGFRRERYQGGYRPNRRCDTTPRR